MTGWSWEQGWGADIDTVNKQNSPKNAGLRHDPKPLLALEREFLPPL